MADDAPPANDPRAFAKWFLDRELGSGDVGVAVNSGELRLTCAVALLEKGLVREALADANAAAALDPGLRARALEIAKRCVEREIQGIRASLTAK